MLRFADFAIYSAGDSVARFVTRVCYRVGCCSAADLDSITLPILRPMSQPMPRPILGPGSRPILRSNPQPILRAVSSPVLRPISAWAMCVCPACAFSGTIDGGENTRFFGAGGSGGGDFFVLFVAISFVRRLGLLVRFRDMHPWVAEYPSQTAYRSTMKKCEAHLLPDTDMIFTIPPLSSLVQLYCS